MIRRQWIREHRADGRILGAGTDSTGPTHFRLSHAGIRTARRHQQIRLTRTHTIGTVAAYQPARAKRYRDIVAVQSRPDPDGNVRFLSGQFRKLITVARSPTSDTHRLRRWRRENSPTPGSSWTSTAPGCEIPPTFTELHAAVVRSA
ncbi:hypothetical protein [Streptomyces sp. NPDC029704]|uniref:hypothetical protein n=1 Tax=Streptomyces sp. NPDC029704 TaxID=3156920 RepID=UPI0034000F84